MQDKSYTLPRLFVSQELHPKAEVTLSAEQSHYLSAVLRRKEGDGVLLFNGRDGEWQAKLSQVTKKSVQVLCQDQRRPQSFCPDVWVLFSPLKRDGTELIIEKATELGVKALVPVITRRSVVARLNVERMQKIALEAAEQSERLDLPEIRAAADLESVLKAWPENRRLYLCAERSQAQPIATVFSTEAKGPSALLIGPEGGFTPEEFALLEKCPFVIKVSLGPRILRAETAALAALSCWQALQGDWDIET